jgi:hypothetical protein
MTLSRRVVGPMSVVAAVVALAAFAGVGFLVGRSNRATKARAATTWASAAAAAYAHARSNAYAAGWHTAYQRGVLRGEAAARVAGTRAGAAAGQAAAAGPQHVARELEAALSSAPIKLTPGTRTATCVPVRGGLCEVLGPAETGKPCPPSTVANPEGGVVCIPRVLLLAAQIAHAAPLGAPPP